MYNAGGKKDPTKDMLPAEADAKVGVCLFMMGFALPAPGATSKEENRETTRAQHLRNISVYRHSGARVRMSAGTLTYTMT